MRTLPLSNPFRLAAAAALSLLVLTPVTAFAQSDTGLPELVTDRPDFTESSEVVGRGIMQLEMGTTVELDRAGGDRDRTLTTPLALMRIGVSRRIELRFSTDGYVMNAIRGGFGQATSNGGADIEVGAKVVLKETTNGFGLALIPMASVPTGSDAMSSGTVDPTLKVTWSKELPKDFGLSGNVNFSRLGDDLGRYTEHALSVSLGHGLAGGWAGYWEAYGFMPQGRAGAAAWTVNSGVTHAIGGNTQIDLEVGRGLTAAAPDWFVGVGVGIRTSALRSLRK